MRYTWLDEYLMAKPAVTKDLQEDWNWQRYKIGDKMFCAVCLRWEDNQPYYINLKLDPAEGEFLRQQYEDIIPGYYSDKRCWNSVKPDGAVPDELLKELLDKSYALVLGGFSKKRQRELLSVISPCGSDCEKCYCFGELCKGCNAHEGKVFHAPEGEACPIYKCASEHPRGKSAPVSCAGCPNAPCDIWRAQRDPKFTDEEFQNNIDKRIETLKSLDI